MLYINKLPLVITSETKSIKDLKSESEFNSDKEHNVIITTKTSAKNKLFVSIDIIICVEKNTQACAIRY